MSDAAVSIRFKIEKATPSGRYVSGWLSVVEKDGKVIEDTQGDRISMDELRKGMHGYMAGDRIIKAHHKGEGIGRMIEMVVVDDDFVKAMGATTTKRGAWGTAEITDETVQKAVREKRFSGFSMGGGGKRTPIEKKGGLLQRGSLQTRQALLRRSIKNTSSAVAGEGRARTTARRLGRAQSYLTRRLARQGHVFKALEDAIEKATYHRGRMYFPQKRSGDQAGLLGSKGSHGAKRKLGGYKEKVLRERGAYHSGLVLPRSRKRVQRARDYLAQRMARGT